MRFLVAPDKFKSSLDAAEVAECIAEGLREVLPDAVITCLPLADGGEGTASVICAAAGGDWHSCEVRDPSGTIVSARYCTVENGTTAVMEMSEASGLWRVPAGMRDPIAASSFGTGEMLLDAARQGAKKIIIGVGGSATNDGGFGMACALGYRFLDLDERELSGNVALLQRLAQIKRPPQLDLPEIIIAADVTNPLLGSDGATRVFGPQKGATPEQLGILDRALEQLADVVARDLGCNFRNVPGSGAAGGLAFGLLSFCSATLRAGFDLVAERIDLAAAVAEADIIITGEGSLDAQTLAGKAPSGVAKLARAAGTRVYAIAGSFDGTTAIRELFDAVVTLVDPGTSDADAMANSARLLRDRAHELASTFRG